MALHPEGRSLRVAYVLKRFPRLSETFIVNELLELERQGVDVEVYSLMRPPQESRHDLLAQLKAPVFYLPRRSSYESIRVECMQNSEANPEVLCDTQSRPDKCDIDGLTGALEGGLATLFAGKSAADASLLWQQAATLAWLCATRGIRHLHAHFCSNAALVALLASRQSGLSFSVTAHARDIYHTYVDREVDDWRRGQIINEAAFIATVSDYNRAHLQQLAEPADRIRVHRLYNGIDLSCFTPRAARQPSDRFVAVGRLVEKKGYPDLIDACARLAASGAPFRLTIIGDGPDREALQTRIDRAGLQQRVELLGACTQQQVIDTLAEAAALVLPCVICASGDRDGLPTALLEAMAMGVPTISTRVAGVPEIIDDGETGLLVPEGDPGQLAAAMELLLRQPQRQLTMGQAGRHKAARLFDLRTNVGRLIELFQRVSAPSTAGEHDAYRLYSC